jgi:hypothetical protein
VAQLARLCAPGGTVILVDFCRAPGPISDALQKRLASMDSIFATPGNWHSAEQYKQLMGEGMLSRMLEVACSAASAARTCLVCFRVQAADALTRWFVKCMTSR